MERAAVTAQLGYLAHTMTAGARQKMTLSDYVTREATSETRHEHVNLEAFAMARGTPVHARLAARITVALGRALDGSPCEPSGSDQRVRTPSGLSSYPDVAVFCGPIQTSDDDTLAATNPALLVEILSESSEAYDRGAKFAHDRSIPGLKEYLLADFREPSLTSHARSADGTWISSFAEQGETLVLRSLDVRLEVDALYRGMVVDPEEGRLVPAG